MSNSAFQTILLILPLRATPFLFFPISPAHSAFVPTLSKASGSKHVTHQVGLCFHSSDACGELHQVRLFRFAALPSNPLLFLPGKCNLAASLNCVCAASKLLSPCRPSPPPLHSLDLFVGNWTKASYPPLSVLRVRNYGHCKSG